MPRSRSIFAVVTLIASLLVADAAHTKAEIGIKERVASRRGLQPALAVVGEDPYTNLNTFHRTLVEPDSFSFGETIVSAFQAGRAHSCGASNLGWSVSTDTGATWTDGYLPGTTVRATPPGAWIRTTDPVVAYDAKRDVWLVAGLGFPSCRESSTVFVSRSTDGARTFDEPIVVEIPAPSQQLDKEWIACDNSPTSPFYGNCYMVWHDEDHHLRLYLSTSTDGGLTWHDAAVRHDTRVIGSQILVQPDGTVILVTPQCCPTRIDTFVSTDGGASYSGHGTDYKGPLAIRDVRASRVHGNLVHIIQPPFLSTDLDADGTIEVVWPDCRFRNAGSGECTQNDIVMSTSNDGRHWSEVVRIPIDARTSSVDHFLPAIAVDPATSGASTRIGVVYYFYPEAECTLATCELFVGFTSSTDGGETWSVQQLAGPVKNTWLPLKRDGYFVGDYVSMSFIDGDAIPVFTLASEGVCELGDVASCNVWTASATIPLR